MLRQKGYTLINILGLAVGTATFILVIRYVQDEFSFDRWHTKGDRIYNVIRETRSGGKSVYSRGTSGGLARAISETFPEVEKVVRVMGAFPNVVYDGKRSELGVWIIDPDVMFSVFDYPFINGSPETAFPHPNSIALTELNARRLFGDEDPIGKTLALSSDTIFGDYTVTAILKDLPLNGTRRFGAIATQPTTPIAHTLWDDWIPTYSYRPVWTYILLKDNADRPGLESKLSSLIDRHMGADIARNNDYHLQPLRDMHLYSRRDFGTTAGPGNYGDINRLYQFVAIALVVLAIACINFTNLTTARSARRAGEVGLRKVAGAHRSQLIGQFLSESVLTAFVSLFLASTLVRLVLPDFNAFFRKQLTLDLTTEPLLAAELAGIALLVALLAGAYPAVFLSRFQPIETMKGTFRAGTHGQWLRKALVSVQFAISITLLIGTAVIYQQLQFIRNKDLGYDLEQVVIVRIFSTDQNTTPGTPRLADRYKVVKQAFSDHPNVLEASAYRWGIGWGGGIIRSVEPEGHEATDWRMPVLEVDEDYLDFYKIALVSGRRFDPITFPADTSRAFLLNQTAVDVLGWSSDKSASNTAIGKTFKWKDKERNRVGRVVGFVSDFHYVPLRDRIGPVALILRNTQFYRLALRVRTENIDETIAFFKKIWARFVPEDHPFRFVFANQDFENIYREEQRIQSLTFLSSTIAITLACMGLFGLASYAVQERRKEIGIRKTLGATVPGLIKLVSREFVVMVLVASAIAAPFAWSIMRGWLDNFAYRTDLGPLVFIFASAITLIIAQLTITFHAYRAAQADPVLALRDE